MKFWWVPVVAAVVAAAGIVGGFEAGVAYGGTGDFRIVRSVAPPCVAEDDPGPCWWDAAARGNGSGMSFWIDRSGRMHEVDR